MRMWMVDPAVMCDRHLLGEHVECHMLAGTLARGRSIAGFLDRGLLEPASLLPRHEALAAEMLARGFRHASPLEALRAGALDERVRSARVDVGVSATELAARCERCAAGLGR